MLLLGIVGGVASGKSAVAACFAKLGAAVLDADRAGHEVLQQADVQTALRGRWGAGIFNDQGEVDRPAVAAIVFAKDAAAERTFLEQLTHPRIGQRLLDQAAQLDGSVPLAILDAALLFEAGWNSICNFTLFVDVPESVRLARAVARGWTEREFLAREAAQWPVAEKRRWTDFTIDNSGTLEQTAEQVATLWPRLVGEGRG